MNRGKANADYDQSTSSRLDKWNAKIARLLGKRKPAANLQQPPSDRKFAVILLAMAVCLWMLTGIYYIPANSYGVVMYGGKVNSIESGFKFGIGYPYPFSEVLLLDASTRNVMLGQLRSGNLVISQDGQELSIVVEASYHIANPRRYFVDYYQETTNLDQRVQMLLQSILYDYALTHASNWLVDNSIIVIANEIRNLSTNILAAYGLQIDKISILQLSQVKPNSQLSTLLPTQAQDHLNQIVAEARLYQQTINGQTENLRVQFNQWLPQYQANPRAISELLYYKMLSSLDERESALPQFKLLDLSLTQFTDLVLSNKSSESGTTYKSDRRQLNRTVVRERSFKDR